MTNRTCSIDNCGAPAWARGWCQQHYNRWHYSGTTDLAPEPTACVRCGGRISRARGSRGPAPSYCSKACLYAADRSRHAERRNAEQRAAHAARLAAITKSCPQCGVEFAPEQTSRQKFCSRKCSADSGRDRPGTVCAEADCDRPVRAKGVCNMHYKRMLRAEGRLPNPEWDDRRRDNYHRRRARKAATATGEPVLLAEIAERDRWRCGLCGERVSRSKVWPDPTSPSIDHIVPLSEGGAHSLANVWLAHLQCNVRKGARGGGEQLALI